MQSKTTKLSVVAALLAFAGFGYYLYSATAQVTDPVLVQAPLNASRSITPAFIMAVDDSGSMDFETLFPTNDGAGWWNSTDNSFVGLNREDQASPGTMNFNRGGDASTTWKKYPYLFPFGDGAIADGRRNADSVNDHFAIPPIPAYGWARSPDVNKAYFDPLEIYQPWVESDGRALQNIAGIDGTTGQVTATSAPADPKRGTFRLDLTNDFTYAGHVNARFMFYGGMTIPQGTYYKEVSCSNGGAVQNTNSDTTIDADGFKLAAANRLITENSTTSRCSVSVRHFPAVFYVLASKASDLATKIGYSTDAIVDDGARTPAGVALRRFEIRPTNFSATDYTAVMNNFANWFTYYRKRHQAARAALSLSFVDPNMKVRAGYFQINGRTGNVSMRRMNNAADRIAIYNSFFGLNTNGGTPNKEAVKYMGEQFRRSYSEGVSPVQLSCQKNFGMLFTDGFSNVAGDNVGNVDGSDAVMFPSPLSDATSNTMADIVAYYYKNDLGNTYPPLGGSIPVDPGCSSATPNPRLDCRDKPHMNFFGVTLGAQGLIYGSPGYEAQTADPYANPPAWPTQFFNRHPSAVDDLWHATLNGRGRFINAGTSGELVRAIGDVVSTITRASNTSGSFAVAGSRVGAGSFSVEPFYEAVNSTDWYGLLTARSVATNADGSVAYTTTWEASSKLPAAADRKIKFGRTTNSVVPQTVDFTVEGLETAGVDLEASLAPLCAGSLAPASCTTTNLNALGVTAEQVINYLRGDVTLEGSLLRDRTGVLGDIVNSSPAVVSAVDDYGYRLLGDTALASSYATFLETKKTAARRAVLVGANDGMLHVFDGDSGVEKFAYIPSTALGHLGNLLFPRDPTANAGQKFDHRYYVDGRITVSDAYVGGAWKTVAVVAAGAGGRGVFALDVTDPASVSVLWEVNDLITGNTAISNRIGHVMGKPIIVPVQGASGVRWKAIFGNGYNSVGKRAALFVVDIQTGEVQTIVAQEAATTDARAYNGLGSVLVLDRFRKVGANILSGNDGYADTVYAGDLNGAVWKFSLLDNSVQLGGAPLFIARDSNDKRQSITGGLEAAAGPGSAAMLYFGTGAFSFEGDANSTDVQTLYAVADRGSAVDGRDDALLNQTVGALTGDYRATSTTVITGLHKGWYIDLPAGQRMVGYPRVESGVIFFPVYEPSSDTSNPCLPAGSNWLYGLNSLSGAAALQNVRVGSPTAASPAGNVGALKLNTSGTAPVTDVKVLTMAKLSTADPTKLSEALASRCSMVVQVAGAPPLYMPRPCGRQSWRQVR